MHHNMTFEQLSISKQTANAPNDRKLRATSHGKVGSIALHCCSVLVVVADHCQHLTAGQR